LIKLCAGLRTDLNKESKQPNLNSNQKAAQLQASCGFETSKLPCSTPCAQRTVGNMSLSSLLHELKEENLWF